MWKIPSTCALFVATVLTVLSWSHAEAQRRTNYGGRINTQRLVRRIEELERRVTALERIRRDQQPKNAVAFDEVPPTVESAQQQLATAQERMDYSERLFAKGYVSEAEMKADEFEAVRAQIVLQLAEAARDGKPTEQLTAQLQILAAEHDLSMAKRQLQLAASLTTKGLAGISLEAHRSAVADAQQRLDDLSELK